MKIFSGVYYRELPIENYYDFNRLEKAMESLSGTIETYAKNNFIFFKSMCNEEITFFDKMSGLSIMGEIDIYNKSFLMNALGFSVNDKKENNALVLEAFKKWGKNCTKFFTGDFAFTIWSEKDQELFCARDPLGQKPFFYFLDKQMFFFGNRIQLFSTCSISRELSDSFILDFLQQNCSARDCTVYKNIKRLLPGHTLSVRKNDVSLVRYWNIEEAQPRQPLNIHDAVKELRWHLYDAVKVRIENKSNLGIELSAGIDSSSIAALAYNYLNPNDKLTAFTNVLPKKDRDSFLNFKDEWGNASEIARFLNIEKHIAIDDELGDPITSMKKSLDITGYPINNFFTLHQLSLYNAARTENVMTLLSGFDGNEIVTEFANNNYKNNLMRTGNIIGLFKKFYNEGDSFLRSILRTGWAYSKFRLGIEKWGVSTSEILREDWKNLVIRNEFLNKKERKEFFEKNSYPPYQTIREKTLYRINDPNLTERLETGYFYSSYFGFQYSYPLLHVPLIEYYFHLNDYWKTSAKEDRALFRDAMQKFLPERIIRQKKNNFTNNTPYLKVSFGKNFQKLKDYCLDLSDSHEIFQFIDKKKILRLESDSSDSNLEAYSILEHVLLMSLFLDREKNRLSS